uniref:Band 7 domain-containing protein n=1 Tax=Octactis speculum TaxID=3111310 RepID=A0A7S2D290_9STRA
MMYPIYPGEIQKRTCPCIVITDQQALFIEASQDFTDKNGVKRCAGEQYRIKGPCQFVPGPYETVKRTVNSIILHAGQGIYVKNNDTSEIRLVEGPLPFLMDTFESLYMKSLPEEQAVAVGVSWKQSYEAIKLQLSTGEIICVVDPSGAERVYMGPQGLLLGPQDEVKILKLSGGKPKGSTMFDVARVSVGPDFMSDRIICSTKDNMEIEMLVTYKWQLLLNQTSAVQLFQTEDFVGIACRKLQSKIRECAAEKNFQEFKVDTVRHLQAGMFSNNVAVPSGDEKVNLDNCLFFEDLNYLVTEVDVKELEPLDKGLKRQFNAELQERMKVLVARMQQEAEVELAKYKQQQELLLLESRRCALQEAKAEQTKEETLGRSRIDQELGLLLAKAHDEVAEKVKGKDRELGTYEMRRKMEILGADGAPRYIEYLRTQAMGGVKQNWIVGTESSMSLPLSG